MAVRAMAIHTYREEAGGLRTPLRTPKQSLVLRPVERNEIGLVGTIRLRTILR